MLRYLMLIFFVVLLKPCRAQYFDTLHIHYNIGVAVLQQKDKVLLDSIARYNDGRKMLIYSYADYLGSERPNQHLSENRANVIKTYLLEKGVTPELIMECTGLGKVPGSGGSEGDMTNRRTDIFIRRKEISKPAVALEKTKPVKKIPVTPREKALVPPAQDQEPPKVTTINLDKLNVNETLNLENIFFYPGRSDILTSSYPELDNLYNVMYDHPKLKIKLEGHVCCCIYPDGFFKDTPTWGLSVDRARRVYEHLINRGIAADRMQYEGFGRTRPIREHERTVEEGQINRRVEIRILEK